MLELFNECIKAGKIEEALLVGGNQFNKHPEDAEVFASYFGYLCTLAETLPSFSDRQNFAKQAGVVLSFYEENVGMTQDALDAILAYRKRVNAIADGLLAEQAEKDKETQAKITRENTNILKEIYTIKDAIRLSKEQKEFDLQLAKVGELDAVLDKDSLSSTQKATYDKLTKEVTGIISDKMRAFEYKKNVEYNKQAAAAYESAFNQFRQNEGKYRNQTQLFALASTTLFAYDASRLFNETLIYYNHVYSYIFSKLDDAGKYALTRFSIECEGKLG